MRNLLSSIDVSRLLRLPEKKVRKLAKQGKLPCIMLPDDTIRFDEQAIERMIHSQKSTSHIDGFPATEKAYSKLSSVLKTTSRRKAKAKTNVESENKS